MTAPGRAGELAALGNTLTSGAAVTVQAVRSMGGVGKSQLATEHAHARASDYDLVFWIAAEEPAAIPDQFAALARQLGLEVPPDLGSLRELVHARLRDVPGWLLIFENAEQVRP